tara:strand:- start:458 stop:1483 length:1026 start_codon:yes stop_codon:yes gene_type:complete
MADYKGIKGFNVQSLSSDPSNLAQGEIWYNSTSNTLKGFANIGASWASGGNLNTGRSGAGSATGTTSAGLCANGGGPAPAADEQNTETYDGTTWTQTGNSTNRNMTLSSMSGTVTAAFIFGQEVGCDSYNGSSWTDPGNDMNTARMGGGGGGGPSGQTSSICGGGYIFTGPPGPNYRTPLTETYDGSSWTEVNAMNTARLYSGSAQGAPQTTALVYGGQSVGWPTTPDYVSLTEQWNGTAWTEVGDLNNGRREMSSFGISTAAFAAGGLESATPPYFKKTEQYNGTAWTEVADMGSAVSYAMAAGSSTAAFAAGGNEVPGTVSATEEWADPTYATLTFTSS